ncbi:MAG: hypothetical protein HY998_01990 [candidate division NC10 bacterium]|nr:hypothetical protein [candidate division NC10 bacterium]
MGKYRLFTTPASAERVASALYLPNYLSFESALSRYGILNLVPYTITFATTRKTRRFTVEGRDAEFRQIKRALFWGYEMKGGIYVARPEKAFLDQIYLVVRGKASIDPDELNLKGLSIKRLRVYSKKFPGYVGRYIEKLVAYPISP